MRGNYLKNGSKKTFILIFTLFILIVLGLIQLYASEKVVKHANSNILVKNKLMCSSPAMLSSNNKSSGMFSRLSELSKKMEQLKRNPKSFKAALDLERFPFQPFGKSSALKRDPKRNVDQKLLSVYRKLQRAVSGEPSYKPNEVLVKFKPFTSHAKSQSMLSSIGMQAVKHYKLVDVYLTRTSPGTRVKDTIEKLKKNPSVRYAEPNYLWRATAALPNDPDFDLQWGLYNTGQTGGTVDADIDASEAWDVNTGSPDVVVAVIDTGVDYTHIDLAGNMWTNAGEIPGNTIDDDNNGYVDDVHGINAIDGSGDPMDDAVDIYHGTHCAGIIAAVGNNSTGISGVCWSSKIMALKFLNEWGFGSTDDAIECIEYMVTMKNSYGVNVKVLSNSWGGDGYSYALEDAINLAKESDILFIAAAGNGGSNNDLLPDYPASYDCLNIISVAASDHNDELAYFSQYGYNSVDVAAPGVNIWSAKLGDDYQYLSGTSMAAPHVSGLAGLIFAKNPAISYLDVKEKIFRTVDKKSYLEDVIASGGRINAYNALTASIQPGPFIYSLSPGIASYGDTIIIEGAHFGASQGSGYVTFFDNVTASIISWNDNQIATNIPDGCQSGPVSVTADGGLESDEKIFTLAGSISGRVTDENSDAVVNQEVQVWLHDSTYTQIGWDFTDGNGEYQVVVPAGEYAVVVLPSDPRYIFEGYDNIHLPENPEACTPIQVLEEEVTGIDVQLDLGAIIRGTITECNTEPPLAVPDVEVYVKDWDTGDWMGYGWSDVEGHYTIQGLPPGTYGVCVESYDSCYMPMCDDTPVEVIVGHEYTRDLCVMVGGSISGRVYGESTDVGIDASVDVYDSEWYWVNWSWTDPNGYYSICGLPTGDYYVATWNNQGYINEWYDNVLNQNEATLVPVEVPNETPNINFALTVGGKIIGIITECNSDPPLAIQDASVSVYDWDTGDWMGYGWSDVEGHYTVGGLPTGTYEICVNTYGNEYLSMCDDSPVTVIVEITTVHDMCLVKGGSISGTINCDHCDEGRICVAVWDGEPGLSRYLGSDCADVSNPNYKISNLPLYTELWVVFWWDKEQEYGPHPPDCGDYIGFYEKNPITLTESDKNPEDIDATLLEFLCECTSNSDCEDELFCNGAETCVEDVMAG